MENSMECEPEEEERAAGQSPQPYLTSPYLSIRLSACLVYAFANLATDHILCAKV